jgi:hypothetical protein
MTLFPSSLSQAVDSNSKVDSAKWLDRGVVAAVLLASAVALSLNVADPDLWGHVQYGRDALAHGLPVTTTYSYVAHNQRWINHEILAEYALAIGADWLGGPELLFAKCLFGVAIVGTILWRALRQGAGLVAACGFTLLVAITLGNHWSLRPQLASYVCFALLLALLSYCFEGWEGRWQLPLDWLARWRGTTVEALPPLEYSVPKLKLLWLAPLLFMIWTNSHGGFLAGLCVYLAYLTLRGAEAYAHKGRAADGLLRRFGLMGAAAVAATFLNPYGPLFHLWIFNDVSVPRPEILEWRAPELFNTQFLPFWLLLVAALGSLAFSRRPRDFTQVVVLGLILWQALLHHRHIAFFAIACGWWLPMHFDSLLVWLGVGQRFKTDEEIRFGWAPPDNKALFAAFSPRMQTGLALGLVVAICISTGQLALRLTTLKVDRNEYPIGAAHYIAERGLTGKMVCTFNWAQYVLAGFGPHQPGQPGILVQVDGRCRTGYTQEQLDMHFDFILGEPDPQMRYRDPRSGPFDPARVLEYERPDLVLINRHQQPSVAVMEGQEGRWVKLYQDDLSQLWGRASRYDDPKSAYYLPPAHPYRDIGDNPQRGLVRWPALPEYRPKAGGDPAVRKFAGRDAGAPQEKL